MSAISNSTATTDARFGWVAPDSKRSTWDIVWGCLAIFLVCSWKCTHLNISSREESEAGWRKLWNTVPYWPERPLCRKWGRKLGWMLLIAVAPEVVVAMAVNQYIDARKALQKPGCGEYTLAHAFYANMGGFILRIPTMRPTAKQETGQNSSVDRLSYANSPEISQAFRPDLAKKTIWPAADEELGTNITYHEMILTLEAFARVEEKGLGVIITEEDIKDRSKADAFTKTFALVQSGWLVVQIIARAVSGLAITQLELVTTAFVFCALVVYIFWWHKPFNVERCQILVLPDLEGLEFHMPDDAHTKAFNKFEDDLHIFRIQDLKRYDLVEWLVPEKDRRPAIAFYGTSMVFSAIHLGAWNWTFPSRISQTLWRSFGIATLATSLGPLILLLFIKYYRSHQGDMDPDDYEAYMEENCFRLPRFIVTLLRCFRLIRLSPIAICLGLFPLVYILLRLAVLGLVFYCFSSMPIGVYENVQWTKFLPHFS